MPPSPSSPPHRTDCYVIHRFCNAPYDLEMILEILENVEKQLDEISENPSVKLYEHFIRRNSPTLHIKHYLNLFGENSDSDFLHFLLFSSETDCGIIISTTRTK